MAITQTSKCQRCLKVYQATSRHKNCASCRIYLDRRPCGLCGQMKQRKSKTCIDCYRKSKQYPVSQVKHKNKEGYIYVYYKAHKYADREGRVLEHRLVMEQKIGRYLYPFESVHHKNGNRSDNRIENLELWTKPQPTGVKVEDAVKWAKEILELYGGVSSVG